MSVVESDSETLDDGISVISLMEAERTRGSKGRKKWKCARVEKVSWWITEHTATANIYLFTQKSSLRHSARLSISSVCLSVFSMQHGDSLSSLWSLPTAPPQRERERWRSDEEVEIWCRRRWEEDGEGGEEEEKRWKRRRESGEMIMQFKIMLPLKREEREPEGDKGRGRQQFSFHHLHSFYVFFDFALSLRRTAHEWDD